GDGWVAVYQSRWAGASDRGTPAFAGGERAPGGLHRRESPPREPTTRAEEERHGSQGTPRRRRRAGRRIRHAVVVSGACPTGPGDGPARAAPAVGGHPASRGHGRRAEPGPALRTGWWRGGPERFRLGSRADRAVGAGGEGRPG